MGTGDRFSSGLTATVNVQRASLGKWVQDAVRAGRTYEKLVPLCRGQVSFPTLPPCLYTFVRWNILLIRIFLSLSRV